MEDRQLDAAESLALIGKMIENTRNRIERNAGRPFLVWGYLTIAFTILNVTLNYTLHGTRWSYIWFAMPVIGGILMYLTRRPKEEGRVSTFVDRVINQIWMVIGAAAYFTTMVVMLLDVHISIPFFISILIGIGTAVTGLIIRFRPAIIGGYIGVIAAPLLLPIISSLWGVALFIGIFVAMMIVPGHILNYRSTHQKPQA